MQQRRCELRRSRQPARLVGQLALQSLLIQATTATLVDAAAAAPADYNIAGFAGKLN